MVIVDKQSTIDYLCIKIAEQMENFEEYANLEGLKAINLTRKNEKGVSRIPSTGDMKDHIRDGETLYCDLTTREYWIKTILKLTSTFFKLTVSLDLKFLVDKSLKTLKLHLIKLAINLWIDYTKGLNNKFHYIISNSRFKTIKTKNDIECDLHDPNIEKCNNCF